jgi:transcriptional regulator with XRE-family HTH domain
LRRCHRRRPSYAQTVRREVAWLIPLAAPGAGEAPGSTAPAAGCGQRAADEDWTRTCERWSRLVDVLSTLPDSMSIMKERAATPAIQTINSRIARRVRALRADLGMTLDGLAMKCAVSRSMISLVERGESSATAVVLEKIATGLGVPLATLFDDATASASPVSRRVDRTSWRDPQSGYVRRNISPANFPSPMRIVEVVLPAGARVAYETGAREVSIHQQIWVQKGSIEVTLGNVTYRLSQDDCLAMRLNEPTAFRNRTRKPARYIVIVASERARASSR